MKPVNARIKKVISSQSAHLGLLNLICGSPIKHEARPRPVGPDLPLSFGNHSQWSTEDAVS